MAERAILDSGLPHPLTPLCASEIEAAAALVKARLGDAAVFSSCALVEPDKATLRAHVDGQAAAARQARLVGYDEQRGATFVALVDTATGTLERLEHRPEVQAPINWIDVKTVVEVTKADPVWQAAMHERGIDSFDLVQIDPWPAGGFIHPSVPQGQSAGRPARSKR